MPTFTDGVVVHQAALNSLSTGINNLSSLLTGVVAPRQYVPAATAMTSVSHSIASNQDTVLTFDTAGINNDNMWVAGGTAFTIQTAGVYIVWAQGSFAANGTGARIVSILLNGAVVANNSVARASSIGVSSTEQTTVSAKTPPMSLAVGAVLYCNVWQSSGAALNIDYQYSGTFMGVMRWGS